MSDEHETVEDENIESAQPNASPLEAVKQHQAEQQQNLREKNNEAHEGRDDTTTQVPGQGPPSDIRHHPQRTQY